MSMCIRSRSSANRERINLLTVWLFETASMASIDVILLTNHLCSTNKNGETLSTAHLGIDRLSLFRCCSHGSMGRDDNDLLVRNQRCVGV